MAAKVETIRPGTRVRRKGWTEPRVLTVVGRWRSPGWVVVRWSDGKATRDPMAELELDARERPAAADRRSLPAPAPAAA